MSPLICRIPHCSVKILFKRKCCQGERGWTMLWDAGSCCCKSPMLIMIHWTRPLNVLGSFLLPSLPASLSLHPSDSRPFYGGSRKRKELAGGSIDNKGFKASELPTAKPLSRQWGSRQPLPSQVLQPHQPWQKAGRTIILTIWLSCWPHTEMGLSLQLWLVLWLACHWR